MKKNSLIIFGAGGLGREIKTLVQTLPEWELIGFCDDGEAPGKKVAGLPVLGDQQFLLHRKIDTHVIVAIGNPGIKYQVIGKLASSSFVKFPSLVHPTVILGDPDTIYIGEGTVISAGCILTTSIKIGNHVLINLNTTVGHDSVIDDCSSIMPGVNLAGQIKIGKCVLVGSGVNVLNKIQIGDNAIIGSGAVVTKDVMAGVTVVGVPAREK